MNLWQGLLLTIMTWILACPLMSFAQVRDRWNIQYDNLPATEGSRPSSFELNLNDRWFLDSEGASLLTLGLQYRELNLLGRTLHLLVPQISWLKMLSDQYSLVLNVRPGFFGDFNGDFGRSFRLEGGAVVTRMLSENLTVGFGLGRGSNFGRDMTVPLLQIFYLPSSTWMIDAVLPVKVEIWYLPSRAWEFGGVFNISGSYYQVENPDLGTDRLGFGNMLVGLSARRQMLGGLYSSLEAGAAIGRRLEWSLNGRERREWEQPTGAYLRTSLNWRF